MICEVCFGKGRTTNGRYPCRECGGCGVVSCCDVTSMNWRMSGNDPYETRVMRAERLYREWLEHRDAGE